MSFTCALCRKRFDDWYQHPPECMNEVCDLRPDEATISPATVSIQSPEEASNPLVDYLIENERPASVPINGVPRVSSASSPGSLVDSTDTSSLSREWEPGFIWRNQFRVLRLKKSLFELNTRYFEAVDVRTGEEVSIRVQNAANENQRARVSEILQQRSHPNIASLLSAEDRQGSFIEVTSNAAPTTLTEWLSTHRMDRFQIESAIRQLASAINDLHERKLVHLNLSPDVITVYDRDDFVLRVGGFENLTIYDQHGGLYVTANPFYSPPEFAGKSLHEVGAGLRCWDWWSLGRIVQEMVLGHHIVREFLPHDPVPSRDAIYLRALQIATEDPSFPDHAGALNAMPVDTDPELMKVLRGLLSTNSSVRWKIGEITLWLGRMPVPDRYEVPKNETLFRWKACSYRLSEAATFFSAAENWTDAVRQVFDGNNTQSLAYWVSHGGAHPKYRERLDELRQLYSQMARFPIAVREDIITGIFLAFCSEGQLRMSMRGFEINRKYLAERLDAFDDNTNRAYIEALIAPEFVTAINAVDIDAGQLLQTYATATTRAIALARTNRWLPNGNSLEQAELLRACLLVKDELIKNRGEILLEFANSRSAAFQQLLNNPKPTIGELAVIEFLKRKDRAELVSHEVYTREESSRLREQGARYAAAITWKALARPIYSNPLLYGHTGAVMILWIGTPVVAMSLFGSAAKWTIAMPLVLLLLRVSAWAINLATLRKTVTREAKLPLNASGSYCENQASMNIANTNERTEREWIRCLDKYNMDILKLKHPDGEIPILHTSRFVYAWGASAVAYSVLFGSVWALFPSDDSFRHKRTQESHPGSPAGISAVPTTPSIDYFSPTASEAMPASPTPSRVDPIISASVPLPQAASSTRTANHSVDESTSTKNPPSAGDAVSSQSATEGLITWNQSTRPERIPAPEVISARQATPDELHKAQEYARKILAPYRLDQQLPRYHGYRLPNSAVLVYDSSRGEVNPKVYSLSWTPRPLSWFKLDGLVVVMMDEL